MESLFKVRLFKEKELEELKVVFFKKAFSNDIKINTRGKKISNWYNMEWDEFYERHLRKIPMMNSKQQRRIEVFFRRYKWKIKKVSLEISMLKYNMLKKSLP